MLLHSTISGNGTPLVILHGLFGSSDNWGSLQRQLSQNFQVVALDLRNHGLSGHQPLSDYPLMAQDVIETLDHLQIAQYHLLGHSMGGKVAMTMAGYDLPGIEKLVVVDITPRDYPPHHQSIFDALTKLDTSSLHSRKEADQALQTGLPDKAVRQFILKNLVRTSASPANNSEVRLDDLQSDENHSGEKTHGFHWRFNLDGLIANYDHLCTMPQAKLLFTNPVLVLRGTKSDYVLIEDSVHFAERFSEVKIHPVNGAGHWPHASHSAQVIDELLAFLL